MLNPAPESEDAGTRLSQLRTRLGDLQLPQIVHGRRAIIVFEGPDGAGKKYALRQLAAAFDPCRLVVYPVDGGRSQSGDGHWLAPFWRALPAAGDTAIFYRSWYRRVLDDRIAGRVDDAALARAFDEINEFEARQRDYGTLIVKLFFDVSAEAQESRLRERAANPWLAVANLEKPLLVSDPGYQAAFEDLKRETDTRWSPWTVTASDEDDAAAVAALGAIADAWQKAMPAEPLHLVTAADEEAA